VLLPNSLDVISNGLFTNCLELENIKLPDSLKEIEEFAFCNCALRTVKLPAGLEKIGTRAFSWCKNLEKVDFGEAAPFMDLGIFGVCPKLSAENVIQGLIRSVNIAKPFHKDCLFRWWDTKDWDSLLREDVFVLALKNNNFALFDKEKLLRKILEKKRFSLFSFLPQMENADWQFSKEFINELILELDQPSCVEYRAWLIDHKRRKYGFDEV
ncbi:MAG: leucine-rich repeat domain-containing protein, partial [Ruminiclostridium sp.]|nr:leucine-rich repeat domain-containing protein [Ruminiclostridium sp.]